MTVALATRDTIDPALIERVVIHGDLRQLNPTQKVSYYKAVCESVGLNPLTQPFQYLVLNGKEILYATRAATEQLRTVHAVSVQIMAREVMEDCYVVTARATLPSGRQDENIGAVPIQGLRGEARANAMMKAETKAKRRVTLAICGLGMLDETEVASFADVTPPARSDAQAGVGVENASEPNAAASATSIDTTTGEERKAPPPGFFYISDYSFRNGWHEFKLLNFNLKGGAITLSTKKDIGFQVEQAYNAGLPIKVTTREKRNARGYEAYLDAVTVYQPEPAPHADYAVGDNLDEPPMLSADEIPF